jgi:hypothetical protein
MELLFSATCYFFFNVYKIKWLYEQPVFLPCARFYVSERPQSLSLNAENKPISSAGCFIASVSFFYFLLPFRPVFTKPDGSWEKQSKELYFQILTKGAVVSLLPMNA